MNGFHFYCHKYHYKSRNLRKQGVLTQTVPKGQCLCVVIGGCQSTLSVRFPWGSMFAAIIIIEGLSVKCKHFNWGLIFRVCVLLKGTVILSTSYYVQ